MFPLFFFFFLLPLLPAALPVLPDPDPVRVQSLNSPPSSIIPAFPEQQSDVSSSSSSSSSCHLSLPSDLSFLTSLSLSSPSSRFCPALAAALYAAYASSALSLPAAAKPSQLPDLPDLPDDPEYCAGEVERAMRARGVELPRVNATCDAAYCYCGVRLRRMSCGGGFVADAAGRSWVPRDRDRRSLERGCRTPGLAGCNTCLRALNQLSGNASASASKDSRECQLMGLTWLLSRNTTLYLPAATSVLRASMASPELSDSGAAADVGPTSCSVPHDEMPFAVGSDEIDGGRESSGARLSPTINVVLPVIVVCFVFLGLEKGKGKELL